jgi:hypothetical protein
MPRRTLQFRNTDDVVSDVRALAQSGYLRTGNWSLGQICDHLAIFLRGSIDGFGEMFPWIVRATLGKFVQWQIFRTGAMRTGVKVPKRFLPCDVTPDAAAVEKFIALVERYKNKAEPMQPSPFFGPLTKDEWTRLHLIHCAHHLSFLTPMEKPCACQ